MKLPILSNFTFFHNVPYFFSFNELKCVCMKERIEELITFFGHSHGHALFISTGSAAIGHVTLLPILLFAWRALTSIGFVLPLQCTAEKSLQAFTNLFLYNKCTGHVTHAVCLDYFFIGIAVSNGF